jgi:exonuclease SbcC
MRLASFTVKGMLRFGDPVTVDLRDLPPGLIAIVGANGEGKSTIIESPLAALYRTFPSRSDRELVDYATGRDSFIDAAFDLEGRGTFRARVNLDGVRRTSEAVLTQTTDAGEVPLTDGKVSTFDAAVARTFPPQALMLASAFSAQNRAGSFATLDRKGRKTLFAQLLGLDHYETLAQTARTAAGLVDQSRIRVRATRDAVARTASVDQEPQLLARQAGLTREHETARQAATQADVVIDQTETALAGARAMASTHQAATLRRDTARVDIQRAERAIADAVSEARADDMQATRDREGLQAQLATALRDLDARVQNNQLVLGQASAIRTAVADLATLDSRLTELRATAEATAEEIVALQTRRRDAEFRVREAEQAAKDLARVREQAGLVNTVPCAGAGAYGACRFLITARQAVTQIPALETVAARVPALKMDADQIHEAEVLANAALTQTRTRIGEAETQRVALAAVAKLAEPLAVAEARLTELARQRETAQAEHAARLQEVDGRLAARMAALADAKTKADAALLQAREAHTAAEAACTATAQAAAHVADLTAQLARLRSARDAGTATLARLEAEAGDLARRLTRIAEARVELAGLEATLITLDTAWLDWTWLAKALGRDGLPVLEIDAAGPTVSRLTNQLLEASFGSRFTVDLVTQEATASGKGMKEAFELKVADGARGGDARDLSDLSGGEQVIVEEALKNALAIFSNSRSQTPVRTAWRDETTGALDGENASRYLSMLRKVREIGGFHHILFVSHNRDAARLADAQIVVHDGQADLVLPPYQEAA